MTRKDVYPRSPDAPGARTPNGLHLDERPPLLPLLDGSTRVWFTVMVAGVLAGLFGWSLSELIASQLRCERNLPPSIREVQNHPVVRTILGATADQVETWNDALLMSALSGVVGLAFGLGGGWSMRSREWAIKGGAIGLVCGAVVGALLPFFCSAMYFQSRLRPADPMIPLISHTTLYATLIAIAGAIFGVVRAGSTGAAQGTLAAVLGGIVGTLFSNLAHTYCFPLEWDFAPIPSSALARLQTVLCVTVAASFCIAVVFAGGDRPKDHSSEDKSPIG